MHFSDYFSETPGMRDWQPSCGRGKTVTWIRGLKRLLRRFRSEEGQSLVEFAFAALMFFFLVLAVFDFAHLFFVEMDVQNAIQEAARYGSTGNHLPDPKNPGQNLSRVKSIVDTLKKNAWGVNVSNIRVSSLKGGSGSAGGPGDMETVSTTVSMPLATPVVAAFFPNGKFTFTASVTVMNEPFPPDQTQ